MNDDTQANLEKLDNIMWLGEMTKVNFGPDDIGILMVKERLSGFEIEKIRALWAKSMGERRLLVLESGIQLGVLMLSDKAEHD